MKLNTAKKLTAGALALSMMFAMATPAFAVSMPEVDASVAITKTLKNVNNAEGAVPDITASMTLDNEGRAVTKPGGVTDDAQISIDDATVEDGTGAFTVHLDSIKVPGIYTYGLTENAVNEAGVKQNDKHYTLTIYALNDPNYAGYNRIVEYKFRLDEVGGQRKLGKVENSYYAGTVEISKVVKGDFGNHEQEFNFEVTLESNLPVTSVVKIRGEAVTFAKNETTGKYVATKDITLQDGEFAGIENLPYGVTYTVKEFTTDASGNRTYAKNNDDLTVNGQKYTVKYDNATGAFAYNTDETGEREVTIINDAGEGDIDTGVILDNAPYMLMLAVVAGGAMMLVIKKRREEE